MYGDVDKLRHIAEGREMGEGVGRQRDRKDCLTSEIEVTCLTSRHV